jgi:hypothetical protein
VAMITPSLTPEEEQLLASFLEDVLFDIENGTQHPPRTRVLN